MVDGSGGIRFDFTGDQGITPGEYRTLRYTIDDVDMGGWTVEWFLLPSLNTANGLDDLRDKATVHKTLISPTAPNIDIPLEPDDLPKPQMYAHELWRTDEGNVRRLSYGSFEVIA